MHRKKKILIAILVVLIVLLGGLGFYVWKTTKDKGSVTFVEEHPIIEYGSKQKAKALVKSSDGKIVSYPHLDTKKLGKQELAFVVEKEGKKETVTIEAEIKDTKPPVIRLTAKTFTCTLDQPCPAEANIKSVKDPVDGALSYVENKEDVPTDRGYYYIEGRVNTKKKGSYSMQVIAHDKNGNKSSVRFQVEVKAQAKTPTRKESIQPTYINGILIVNKQFGLPSDFGKTDPTAYAALEELQTAAQKAGYDMPLLSGYRSYAYQVDLYNAYVERDGKAKADTYSARPGHSEHQSGLAFDIGAIDDAYGETPGGKWLAQHCADYGFIIRFPKGKEALTGYQYEPWHVRYVGKVAAQEIMTRGICLEEYLGVAQ